MKTVIIESPFASNAFTTRDQNTGYALQCLRHSINLGEAPFASHLFYPQLLDEDNKEDRELGITLGYSWWPCADEIAFYTDLGWSRGMLRAYRLAHSIRKQVTLRTLTKEKPLPPPDTWKENQE